MNLKKNNNIKTNTNQKIGIKHRKENLSLTKINSYNNISNLFNTKKENNNNSLYRSNYKYFTPLLKKNITLNPKIDRIKPYSLKKLKKIETKKSNYKTLFKGIESLSIKPKEIYDLFNKEKGHKIKKYNNNYYDIREKEKKEEEKIEKNNEYKIDIKEILDEENEIRNIINTREFSNILGNNKFFKEVEYKNEKEKILKKESKTLFDNTIEPNNNFFNDKNKKIDYLKKIAFKPKFNFDSQENKNKFYFRYKKSDESSDESNNNFENYEENDKIKKRTIL